MLDENLPTFTFRPSSDNPLNTLVYYTYQGSEPAAEYLLKRPSPHESPNQYAFGLFDAHAHILYAELLLKPDWTQATLSAAELRAQNGVPPPANPITPDSFTLDLYNPDQSVTVKQENRSWGRSDIWEFEIPERSFKQPSRSRLDTEGSAGVDIAELTPRVMFVWKKDGKLTKDMTCYMSGRNVGGKKSKEPDITVALFRSGRHDSGVTIYEPNMARVDVEDRKGLEVALLLTAEAIRDLYLAPRANVFNTAGAPPPDLRNGRTRRKSSPAQGFRTNGGPAVATMSGANAVPSASHVGGRSTSAQNRDQQEAEARRVQEELAREERERRERQDREEQESIKRMLQEEERERQRRAAEVDAETERLRREYGVQNGSQNLQAPQQPPRRPNSAGPSPHARFADPPTQDAAGPSGGTSGTPGLGGLNWKKKNSGPYALGSSAAATMSGFFGRGDDSSKKEKEKKVKKKRSVHF